MGYFINPFGIILKRGILVIYEAHKERGLPEPEITSLDAGILVAVFKNEACQKGDQMGGQAEEIIMDLTDKQKEVLAYIFTDPKISRKLMSEMEYDNFDCCRI